MAKQLSMKQQIYQQIANKQVQEVLNKQREQETANLMADFDSFMQQKQNPEELMADFNSFMQQQNSQPVQQAVQAIAPEVKATPVIQEKIPSIADIRRDDNLKYRQDKRRLALENKQLELENKRKEDYQRQQQEENMLASQAAKRSKEEIAKDIVENKTVDKFAPQVDIQEQNIVNDYRKNLLAGTKINKQSEELKNEENDLEELAKVFKASMKDYNPKFTAAGKRWENPYDSLTDEQKQLVRDYIIQNQNNTNLSKEERETLKAFNRAYNSSDEEKDSRYNGRAAYLNSKNDFERGLQSLAGGFTDFNMPVAELLGKGFSKLPILNQIDYEKSRDDTREYINESKALNPQAAEAGRSLGQIYDYAVTSPFVGAAGEVAKLGKVGTAALNQVFQLGQDIGLDIYPEAQRMLREEGKIDWGELLKRGATDVIQNGVMEAVPYFGAFNYDSLVKSIGNNADIFKNIDATGALKNAPDAIRSVADATNNIKAANEGTQQIIPGMETESDVVNNINNDFSRLMEMYQPERTAMKNIYSAEDLNNSLNSQLANALKANQADEVAESVAKAMPETPMDSVANTVEDATKAADNVSAIKTEISDMTDAVIDRIYNVGYKVDAVNDEALNKSYRELLDYNEKWAKAISNSTDIEEIKRATKDLNNAISRFNTKAKKIDPSIAKDIYNRKFSSMLNSFNTRLDDYYNGAKRSKEAADLILGSQSDDALKEISELQNSKQALFDDVRNGRISARDYSYRMNEINRAESKLIDKYPDWYDNGTLKGTLEDYVPNNATKTMAEEISKPKSEVITSDPIDYGKYEGTDTPKVKPNGPDEAPNMKVSEAYTNTGKRGGGWNETEYGKYTNPDDYLYESIDEVRSVEEATNMRATEGREAFKNRVLGADRVSSVELDGLMMEWRELTEEARALEEAGQDAADLWAESNKVFRKVQEQSSNNAQALQALAKWSRNTPEGMLINAENIVNGKNKVAQSDLQKFIEKHFKQKKGNIEFSPEFEKEFLKTAEPLRGLRGEQLDTREAKEIMAQLGKMVNEQLPVKLNEKLQSFLMDNMLGNFRTLITRNAGGNLGLNVVEQIAQRPLAAGIDSLVSLKTGRRTQARLSKAGLVEYMSGFKKGLADEVADFKSGLHTARSGENTLENAIRANRHVFQTKVADGLDGLVKNGLSVGDRPYYEAVYKQTLGDYYRLRERGLMGEQIQSLSDADFKLYAETAAKMNGLGAVYQQDTMLSNALMGFKKDVGMLSNGILGVDILSQFSMPFVKTPANVIERAIDYSPLGIVRNAFRTGREIKGGVFDQNRFANEAARNILGTGMMGAGAAYAANGGLSGGYSDNANEKQAQREAGMQEYAWNVPKQVPGIGGKQMDISWLPVLGSNMVASAAAVDAYKNGEGNVGENLTQGLQAGGEALFDQSMFQGLQRLFGTGETYNSDEGIMGNMKNVVTSGVGQAIPSLLRQVAQVSDEYQRDTSYSNKGTSFGPFNTYAINSLANNIPGLRESYLAPKVDTSGNLLKENQGRNLGMKVLEDMILPGKITDVNMSPLAQEATRLADATSNAFLKKADRNAVDTEEHPLTNDEWVKYQQNYYKQMTSAGEKLIGTDVYKNANSEAQAKMLSDVYGEVKSAINSAYNGKKVDGAAKAYVDAGGGDKGVDAVVNYLVRGKIFENYDVSSSDGSKAILENHGEAGLKIYSDVKHKLNGSQKKEDIERALNSTSLSEADKAEYYSYFNTSATPGQNPYGYVSGINYDPKNDESYQKAVKASWNVSPEEFYKAKDEIDTSNSGGVSQTEIADYLNKKGVRSDSEAMKIYNTFKQGSWKKLPVLQNNSWTMK